MDRSLLLLSFLLLAAAGGHAASSPQLYWHSVLPNTPMPKAISDLLSPGKGGGYNYAATEGVYKEDADRGLYAYNVAFYFLEKDLRPGAKRNLHFTETTSGATFLPRQAADSIPFSSSKLPAILDRLSIESDSVEAKAMKKTLKECEEPAVGGEKYCATSLEAMVEFSTSSLGTHDVKAISTTVEKEGTPAQLYTIRASGVRRMAGTVVACHPENYPYAVFYCHATTATRAYTVEMVGKDGTQVEAVAVCHTDTKAWNPKNRAFQVLKVKPGTVPVCHFLPQDHVVWSRRS